VENIKKIRNGKTEASLSALPAHHITMLTFPPPAVERITANKTAGKEKIRYP
jgi:hypothetical protein